MYQTKKIVVTGGAGFIGSALVSKLQTLGHEIYVIDNLSSGNRKFIDLPDTHFLKLDILNSVALEAAIQTIAPEWIIHLAAIHFIPYCNQNPIEASQVNIQGTINVLKVAKTLNNLEKVFFASTAAVYPIYDQAIPETLQPEPKDIYGLSKLVGEHLLNEFHLQTAIPTVVGRFFNAFGLNETNPHVIPEIQRQVNSGMRTIRLGNLEPKRDFIHTSDMAIAITRLLEQVTTGQEVFNIGSGIEYSVKDIVQSFGYELGEELVIHVDPDRVRRVERMHLLADISKLKAFINWQPLVNLDDGIKTLVDVRTQPTALFDGVNHYE
ncbi:NAD-dependent epimerase/dehydratase family protein [Phormidesmis sp. 146-35]